MVVGKDGRMRVLGTLSLSALYAVVYFALSSGRDVVSEFGLAALPLLFGAVVHYFGSRWFRNRMVIASLAPVFGLLALLAIEVSFDWKPRDRIGIAGYGFVLAQTGVLAALGALVAKGLESMLGGRTAVRHD